MPNYRDLFVKNARKKMKDMGLNQENLAKRLGVSQGAISTVLSGANDPGLDLMARYAAALECDVTALLSDPIASPRNEAEERLAIVSLILSLDKDKLGAIHDVLVRFASSGSKQDKSSVG